MIVPLVNLVGRLFAVTRVVQCQMMDHWRHTCPGDGYHGQVLQRFTNRKVDRAYERTRRVSLLVHGDLFGRAEKNAQRSVAWAGQGMQRLDSDQRGSDYLLYLHELRCTDAGEDMNSGLVSSHGGASFGHEEKNLLVGWMISGRTVHEECVDWVQQDQSLMLDQLTSAQTEEVQFVFVTMLLENGDCDPSAVSVYLVKGMSRVLARTSSTH